MPGLKVTIKELDDVLMRDVGNRIQESGKYVDPCPADYNPLPDDKILDWSKLKQIADDTVKCTYNGK